VEAFQTHPWLNMLHLHVGSQGLPTERIVEGVVRVWELLEEVEAACGTGRVTALDIGGGLTVDFDSDVDPPVRRGRGGVGAGVGSSKKPPACQIMLCTSCPPSQRAPHRTCPPPPTPAPAPPPVTRFQEQAALLRQHVPGLFQPSCHVQLLTENGRSLVAKAGCVAARVEYTKSSGGRHIAVTHVGADLFMRACYLPDTWGLRVFVCDAAGAAKGSVCSRGAGGDSSSRGCPSSNDPQQQEGGSHHPQAAAAAGCHQGEVPGDEGVTGLVTQDIAGPLCFQGDRLAVAAALPRVEVGDHVMVVDAGAYTLSMYSRWVGPGGGGGR
jgi:diaminopimelate decarboxylase